MTPTLNGRIQSRWFVLLLVGIPWTIAVGPLLLPFAGGASLGELYSVAWLAVALVGILGTGWEMVYHLLMQLRWEKDWPTLFGLVTGVNELLGVLVALAVLGAPLSPAVVLHFGSLWVLIWLVANGPLRVVLPRWRYQGGRVL